MDNYIRNRRNFSTIDGPIRFINKSDSKPLLTEGDLHHSFNEKKSTQMMCKQIMQDPSMMFKKILSNHALSPATSRAKLKQYKKTQAASRVSLLSGSNGDD